MLPSRGLITSSRALGLRHTALPQPSMRQAHLRLSANAGSSRQFGTALRSHGRPFAGAASIGVLSGSRIGSPAVLRGVLSKSLPSARQARFSSTETVASNPLPEPPSLSSTPLELDGSALLNMPEQIGYLHALGLDFGWGPTSCLQWLLEHVHIYSGLPWWGSIALVPLIIRALIFVPSLSASEQSHKFSELRKDPRWVTAMAKMQGAARREGPKARAETMEARGHIKAIQNAAGIQMWRMAIPFINLPIALGMFRLLRNMTGMPVPGLEDGGLLWFQDLTVADPYFILPVASAAMMYWVMRVSLPYLQPQQAQMMKMISYGLGPLSLIFTMKFAAGIQWFILVGAVLQGIQSSLFYQPWLRRWANLPPLEPVTPPAPSQAAASPSSAASKWHAPRTISTTARVEDTGAVAEKKKGPFADIKESYSGMMGKVNSYLDDQKTSSVHKKAQEYEKRRAREEEEKLELRREELRRRMEQNRE